MTAPTYDLLDVPVEGGTLRVGRWIAADPQAPVVLAVHGVTANHLAWQALGALDRFTVIAPDLRGRGRSHPQGPAGMDRHADDLRAVLDHLDLAKVRVVGHSMGGFVAAAFADRHAGRAESTVLVDGGLPFPPLPAGTTAEQALEATIGPAAARLRMTFDSTEAYVEHWRPHPALAGHWTAQVEAYVAYDLDGDRSSVSLEAVHDDSADLLDAAEAGRRARALPDGTPFLRAPRGMLDGPGGLYPAALVEQHRADFPAITVHDVPDTNHYTIVMSEHGALAIAAAVEGAGR